MPRPFSLATAAALSSRPVYKSRVLIQKCAQAATHHSLFRQISDLVWPFPFHLGDSCEKGVSVLPAGAESKQEAGQMRPPPNLCVDCPSNLEARVCEGSAKRETSPGGKWGSTNLSGKNKPRIHLNERRLTHVFPVVRSSFINCMTISSPIGSRLPSPPLHTSSHCWTLYSEGVCRQSSIFLRP